MAFINIMDIVYPIGTAYMSTTSTSPATLFGGTWSEVKNALLSTIGYGGATAGQYSGNNSMTKEQMPAHDHKVARWESNGGYWEELDFQQTNASGGSLWFSLAGAAGTSKTTWAKSTGGGNPSTHTIIPSIVGCELLSFSLQDGDVVWHL